MNDINNYKKINFEFFAHEICPVCQNKVMIPDGKFNWLETDFWYVVCPSCGLKFMNPMPKTESYRYFYKNLFWQQKIRNLGYHQTGQAWQTGQYKWDNEEPWNPEEGRKNRMDKHKTQRVKTIIPILEQYITINKDTKVLEVGCGYGLTLEELYKKHQCQVYAIEPSEDARSIIKGFNNIELLGYYAEELSELAKKNLKFDVIIFSHVLENIIDPLNVIRFAKVCLKDDGIIYIQTPNLLVNDQMNPYHPYIFSLSSLQTLTEKAGLKCKQVNKLIERMLTIVCLK